MVLVLKGIKLYISFHFYENFLISKREIIIQIGNNMMSVKIGDVWGGISAMLVALPSAVAFGLLVYSPMGLGTHGAIAGIIGVMFLGTLAGILGGTPKLISAPCAPAAAVLSAFVISMLNKNHDPVTVAQAVYIVSLLSAMFQIVFGLMGGGKIIKFIPYPVVSGYLSGVGALIVIGQASKFLGGAFVDPASWSYEAIVVGISSMLGMIWAPKISTKVPAPVFALISGVVVYWLLSLLHPQMRVLADNKFIIGSLSGNLTEMGHTVWGRWLTIPNFSAWKETLIPAFTLAVLLSVDTLKTCVVLEALTQQRSDSNRELRAQGIGNLFSSFFGGVAGAGTMGATLVNISAGGITKLSAVIMGISVFVVFILFSNFVSWVPLSALAGILIVIAYRMVDKSVFILLKNRSTWLDFAVISSVVLVAIFFNLIAAAGVGVLFSIILFLREIIRSSVVRRVLNGHQISSKKKRLPDEVAILTKRADEMTLIELQGNLFFGTTDQMMTQVNPYLFTSKSLILDLSRVQSIDYSASHKLHLLYGEAKRNGASVFIIKWPFKIHETVSSYFKFLDHAELFDDLNSALEIIEDSWLSQTKRSETLLNVFDFPLFSKLTKHELTALNSVLREHHFERNEIIFKSGDIGDQVFFIRQGDVKIELPLKDKSIYIAQFGAGDFFGDMAFLDHGVRSAQAIAESAVDLYSLSRLEFNSVAEKNPKLAGDLFGEFAKVLAIRLRHTDSELRAVQEF